MHVLAAFGPASTETAIFYIGAVVCFGLAAFASALAGRFPGGALGLIAVGLALWLWPLMWSTTRVAF
jgi:hypothetical protein